MAASLESINDSRLVGKDQEERQYDGWTLVGNDLGNG
jgi:hypothetical protein